jgi:predicted PurR-regulated permease PerM
MDGLLKSPWARVLLVATTVAMASFALRETASITMPVVRALYDVLVPVAIGFVIAYVLTPVVDLISRRVGTTRIIATALLYLAALGVVGAGAGLVAPALVREAVDLANLTVNGEDFRDDNRNGEFDEGEVFSDRNSNGRHDTSLISQAMTWAERKRGTTLAVGGTKVLLDEGALAMLGVALTDTASGQERLLHALRLARDEQRHGAPPPPDIAPLVARLREARRAPLADDEFRRLRAEADLLAQRAQPAPDGSFTGPALAATELLRALDRGASAGREFLTKAIGQAEQVARDGLSAAPQRLGAMAAGAFASADAVFGFLLDLVLTPIYAFFLTLAMPTIRARVKEFIPARHKDHTLRLVREIERAVAAFFRGRLVICTICALVGTAGFLVSNLIGVGTPYGVLFGIGIGVLTVVPLAGLLLLVPALVVTWLQPGATGVDLALVVGIYVLVQTVEATLIPLIMGREVELHPVTLIIALLLCGKLLGILGLILAVPIAATARILAREFLWPRLRTWAAAGMDVVAVKDDPAQGC